MLNEWSGSFQFRHSAALTMLGRKGSHAVTESGPITYVRGPSISRHRGSECLLQIAFQPFFSRRPSLLRDGTRVDSSFLVWGIRTMCSTLRCTRRRYAHRHDGGMQGFQTFFSRMATDGWMVRVRRLPFVWMAVAKFDPLDISILPSLWIDSDVPPVDTSRCGSSFLSSIDALTSMLTVHRTSCIVRSSIDVRSIRRRGRSSETRCLEGNPSQIPPCFRHVTQLLRNVVFGRSVCKRLRKSTSFSHDVVEAKQRSFVYRWTWERRCVVRTWSCST